MLTPFREFDDTLRTLDLLHRRFERAFDGLSLGPAFRPEVRVRRRGPSSWPLTNVFETKEAFVVQADVPGLAEGAVSVSVEDDVLILRGERTSQVPQGYKVHVREREPIAFNRTLALPGRIDADAVSANLVDGVLTVTLPKAQDARPRQIAVKAAR